MADHDHMRAAEPDWLAQADEQMSDLFSTLEEIGDPTATEAWSALDDRLHSMKSQANFDATELDK